MLKAHNKVRKKRNEKLLDIVPVIVDDDIKIYGSDILWTGNFLLFNSLFCITCFTDYLTMLVFNDACSYNAKIDFSLICYISCL